MTADLPPLDAWRPARELLAAFEAAHACDLADTLPRDGATTNTEGDPMTEPVTPATPAQVATMLTDCDGDYHDGYDWNVSAVADDATVLIRISPYSEDGDELPTVHFRAVVVEGETAPLVIDRAVFARRVNARFDAAIRKLGDTRPEVWAAHIAVLREQILAADVELAEDAR